MPTTLSITSKILFSVSYTHTVCGLPSSASQSQQDSSISTERLNAFQAAEVTWRMRVSKNT